MQVLGITRLELRYYTEVIKRCFFPEFLSIPEVLFFLWVCLLKSPFKRQLSPTLRPAKSWGKLPALTSFLMRLWSCQSHDECIARESNVCMGNKSQKHCQKEQVGPLPYIMLQRAHHPIILEGHKRPPEIRLRSFLAFVASKEVAVVTSSLLVLFHHLPF